MKKLILFVIFGLTATLVMKNEGGYNSTGLCADCVLEVFNKINFDENISS
jgi:hypothetical protein